MDVTPRIKDVRRRGIERAIEHIEEYWLPSSPQVRLQLAETLKKPDAEWSPQNIFEIAKQDLAIFTRMLKELSFLAKRKGRLVPISPLRLFTDSEPYTIRDAFTRVSNHTSFSRSISDLLDCQTERLQEIFISASASEVLADSFGIGSDLGYATALLRQLGLTLVAFNYPAAFEEVLATAYGGTSLDTSLSERLGFSPTLLAYKMIDSWGLSPTMHEVYDEDSHESEKASRISAISQTLRQVCEVGEALARANNPDAHPEPADDWDFARREIEKALGKSGLNLIRRCLERNTKKLAKAMPQVFKCGFVLDPEIRLSQRWKDEHHSLNPFLSACEPQYRDAMHRLYEKLITGVDINTSLAYLIKEVVPEAGLGGGCLFTADPSTQALIPQLKVGSIKHRTLAPVSANSEHDLVARAFLSFVPLTEKSQDGSLQICGVVGYSNRIGVLYFEVPAEATCADPVAHFRALAKSFSDTLKLG